MTLSRVPAIRVIARQTARTYRGRAVDVAAIRAELGVHYLVEGSVRMQGPTVRINVALVNAENRLQVWSDRFERSEAERFAVQDEIARGLARRLQLGVVTFEADRRDRKGAGDPTIAEHLAKGWAIAFRSLRTGVLDGAAAHFEAALGLDPDSLSALVGLAMVHIGHVQLMLVPEREPSLVRAEELLARPLRLYPQSSVPHYTLGVLRRIHGKFEPALASLARALELNPSYAPAYAQVGSVLTRLGRPEEALEHIRYAIRLSPNDPHLPSWLTFGGIAELNRGNDQVALDWLNRAATLNPRLPFTHAALAATHALKGDTASASRHVTDLRKLAPTHTTDQLYRWFTGPGGKETHGQRYLQGLRMALNPGS